MDLPMPWLLSSVAVRTFLILTGIVVGVRLFGKRDVGDLNLIDVLMILLIGNAVQNALTYGSGSLGVGLVSAATLLIVDYLMGVLFNKQPWLEDKLFGEPAVIATDGRLDEQAMEREGVSEDEVRAALRSMGLKDLGDVRLAVLEENGTISIVPREGKQSAD